jgi:hypothetical protein
VAEKVTSTTPSRPKKRCRITPAEGIFPRCADDRCPRTRGCVKTSCSVPESAKLFIPLISKRRLPRLRAAREGPTACFLRNTFLKSFAEACGLGTSSLRLEPRRLM